MKQIGELQSVTLGCMRGIPEPEDPHVYRRLIANLDHRQSQLATEREQQCIAKGDGSERHETHINTDGAWLESNITRVDPFNVAAIIAAIDLYTPHVSDRGRSPSTRRACWQWSSLLRTMRRPRV